ncbi:Lipid A core - O-antigen ligase and related enzymes [Providencia rustigianii]|nr:Lipid A core - O-antigen ligase and related enzymes [Providencia rustigianii]
MLVNLFIFLTLFFPAKYFDLYHIVVIIPLILLGITSKPTKGLALYITIIIIIYWIFTSWIRSLVTGEILKDLSEIFRFIPLALLFLFRKNFININKSFISIVTLYLWINFLICILQYLFKDSSIITYTISIFYNSEVHLQESLLLNSRALGLSPGPNSNGIMCLLLTLFIIFKFNVNHYFDRLLKYSTILIGTFSILLSQSQTAFLTFFIIATYITILYLVKKPFFIIPLVLVILSASILFLNLNLLQKLEDKQGGLYYLSTLFKEGTERSSYKIRIEKRERIINSALETPEFVFIGWGKDYFGSKSSATDNEHIYIALVYGPLIWFSLILVAFLYGLKYTILFLKRNNKDYLFKSSIILGWVVISIPAAFITDPQILILSALFLNNNNEQ